ncbi:MAG TPA: metalloregulator ArsR/SmtB family transcription factor [Candidatus Saccharimonadales bacterium]|nr:metalloregulator ArsR/SmtB family transcription factor [Candidatus Saccharimonadales bacterium]
MVNASLSNIFSALSDPTRRDILQRVLHKEQSVNQLANAYAMSLPAVSKHIKILEAAQLITKERVGRQYIIRLSDERIQMAAKHLLEYQTTLDTRLESLDHYLQGTDVAADKPSHTSKPSNQTLTMSHVFNATPRQVWDAYTEPRHIERWWGASTIRLANCYNDVRVGGMWRFAIENPHGQEIVVSGQYKEVTPYQRLTYTDGFGEPSSTRPQALVTITLEQLTGGKTKLTKTSTASKAVHQLQASWLRLAQEL